MIRFSQILTFLLLACGVALAVPDEINFQGRLTDDGGVAQSGTRTMALTLHDAATGGTLRYTENLGEVTLTGGIYSFRFGKAGTSQIAGPQGAIQSPGIAAALAAAGEHWLELVVDGVPQLPRQRLLAVPYAMLAGDAARADRLELQKNAAGFEAIEIVRGNGEIQRVTVPNQASTLLANDGSGVNATAFRKAIGLPPATTIHVGDHGAVGNGIADDTAAIAAAFAKARTTLQPVIFEPGKRYRVSAGFNLDWVDVRLIGYGASIFCSADNFNLFTLGNIGGPTQRILIDGLTLIGTSSGHQVGIDCLDWAPKMITLRDCKIRDFGGSGLYSRHTDYMLIEKCHFIGNIQSGWTGGFRTNVTTIISTSFNGQNGAGESITKKHIHAIDVDGLCMISSEFGDGDYGLYLDTGAGGFNTGITLRNCRTERVRINEAVLGTGLGAALPSNISFEECTFMGSNGDRRNSFIIADRCYGIRIRQCTANQMGPGSALLYLGSLAQTRGVIEDCIVHGSATVSVYRSAGGAGSSARRIVFGGDASLPTTLPHTIHFAAAPLVKATDRIPCGVASHAMAVRQVVALQGSSLISTAKAYWDLELRCFRAGVDQGVIASGSTKGVAQWTAFSGLELTLGAAVSLQSGDALVLAVRKGGRPAALRYLTVTVVGEPE